MRCPVVVRAEFVQNIFLNDFVENPAFLTILFVFADAKLAGKKRRDMANMMCCLCCAVLCFAALCYAVLCCAVL